MHLSIYPSPMPPSLDCCSFTVCLEIKQWEIQFNFPVENAFWLLVLYFCKKKIILILFLQKKNLLGLWMEFCWIYHSDNEWRNDVNNSESSNPWKCIALLLFWPYFIFYQNFVFLSYRLCTYFESLVLYRCWFKN